MLNELECVRGAIYANVWQTDEIVRIDPASGEVTGTVDARGLLTAEERIGADVLNGIAYVPETGRFLLTGKLWPAIFEVELSER
jgi:glutaminyl-peptide cyclotransferase